VRGSCDQALQNGRRALEIARKINHPLSEAFAACLLGTILLLRRDYEACEQLSRKQVEFSSDHGFVFWHAAHQVMHGASAANRFHRRSDAALAKEGIDNWRKTDALLHVPTWSSFLADAALACGDLTLADETIADGLKIARENNDLLVVADLQRLRGQLLLRRDQREDALSAFAEALETARNQGSGLYLLRAARDMARQVAEDDRRQAIELLAPALARFRENRDGLDYQESVAALLEMGGDKPPC